MNITTADITLSTERITLRPIGLRDAIWLCDYAGDYEVAKMLSRVQHPLSRENVEAFIRDQAEQNDNDEGLVLAIIADEPVGCIGLDDLDSVEVELGYWIGRPFWGQGYASEAAGLVTEYVLETLGRKQLNAAHFIDNLASGRVLEKVGFRYTGDEEQRRCHARGQEVICKAMRITRDEWRAHKACKAQGKAG